MTFFFRVLLFFIGAAALLPYLPTFPPYRWLWTVELLVTELSPYLFAFLFLCFLFVRGTRARLACGLVAILVSAPILMATSRERDWIWDLEYGMGKTQLPDPGRRSPYIGELDRPLWTWKGFFERPPEIRREEMTYQARDKTELQMFRYPARGDLRATGRPFVVIVHGGGWNGGDPDQIEWMNGKLNEAGFEVFAPRYRLAPKHRWPKQMEDVQDAIASIQARSGQLGIDPKNFFLLGRSAGGQIALKIAYADRKVRPEGLRGVIAFYAPTDLEFGYRWALPRDVLDSKFLMESLTGGAPDSALAAYRDASPIHDVSSDDPPTLLLYGRPDPLVWYRHGERLEARLRAAGVPVAHIRLPWATHGFDYFSTGLGGQVAWGVVVRYLGNDRN